MAEAVVTSDSRARRSTTAERIVAELLERADVRIDGRRPWDLRVHDGRFFDWVLGGGSLALGESYLAGAWDCEQLDGFFHRVLAAGLERRVGASLPELWLGLKARLVNLQKGCRAFAVAKRHYDLGNQFFARMLDRRMTYSCGYWRGAASLDDAQEAKLDLICRKIELQRGERILDIGCGWGSFAGYAAERYGASVVGLTVSEEQAAYARQRYAGLPVQFHVRDYREADGGFDHVVSVGMFEHVGPKNHRAFMETAARCLSPDGCLLLHTIGCNGSTASVDPWIEKYIFPNSMLPSAAQITAAAEGLFVLRDWHAFGRDYDPTLMAWHANCERLWRTERDVPEDRFRRMWRYYLLACAGSFRADDCQLWQVLFTKRACGRGDATVR